MNMRFLGLAIAEAVRQKAWGVILNHADRRQAIHYLPVYAQAATWTDAQYASGTVPPTGWVYANA